MKLDGRQEVGFDAQSYKAPSQGGLATCVWPPPVSSACIGTPSCSAPPAPSLAAATLPSAGFWGFVCPVRLSLLVLYPHMSEIPGF